MGTARVKSLKVRPFQSVDLCFEIDGIIGEQNLFTAKLGETVKAFDLNAFYKSLTPPQPTAGDINRPGLLKFDSQAIHTAVAPSLLYGLGRAHESGARQGDRDAGERLLSKIRQSIECDQSNTRRLRPESGEFKARPAHEVGRNF